MATGRYMIPCRRGTQFWTPPNHVDCSLFACWKTLGGLGESFINTIGYNWEIVIKDFEQPQHTANGRQRCFCEFEYRNHPEISWKLSSLGQNSSFQIISPGSSLLLPLQPRFATRRIDTGRSPWTSAARASGKRGTFLGESGRHSHGPPNHPWTMTYPLNISKLTVCELENHHVFLGKATMAMFNSKLLVYQRVVLKLWWCEKWGSPDIARLELGKCLCSWRRYSFS